MPNLTVQADAIDLPLPHPTSDLDVFLLRPVDPGLLWRPTVAHVPSEDYPDFNGVVAEDILRSRAGIEAEVERLIAVLDAIDAASEDLEDEDAVMFGGAGA